MPTLVGAEFSWLDAAKVQKTLHHMWLPVNAEWNKAVLRERIGLWNLSVKPKVLRPHDVLHLVGDSEERKRVRTFKSRL